MTKLTSKNIEFLTNIATGGREKRYVSNMGGARRRMKQKLGEGGFLIGSRSKYDGSMWYFNKLTPAGYDVVILNMQKKGHPRDVIKPLIDRSAELRIELDEIDRKADAERKAGWDHYRKEKLTSNDEKIRQWKALNHPDASSDDNVILSYIDAVGAIDHIHISLDKEDK